MPGVSARRSFRTTGSGKTYLTWPLRIRPERACGLAGSSGGSGLASQFRTAEGSRLAASTSVAASRPGRNLTRTAT